MIAVRRNSPKTIGGFFENIALVWVFMVAQKHPFSLSFSPAVWIGPVSLLTLCVLLSQRAVAQPKPSVPAILRNGIQKALDSPGFQRAIKKLQQAKTEFYSPTAADIVHFYDLKGKETGRVQGGFYSFSPSGKGLILMPSDRFPSFSLFDAVGKDLAPLTGEAPTFSPDGQWLYTIEQNFINVYSITGQKLARIEGSLPTFLADSSALTVYDERRHATLFYGTSGQPLGQVTATAPTVSPYWRAIAAQRRSVQTALLDLKNQTTRKAAQLPGELLGFSSDGTRLATFRNPGLIVIADIAGQTLAEFEGAPSLTDGNAELLPAFSPDGRWLTVNEINLEHSVLYDPIQGRKISQLDGIYKGMSPSSDRIATISLQPDLVNKSYLYDMSGKRIAALAGNFNQFSPQGQYLITFTFEQSDPYDIPALGTFHVYDKFGQAVSQVPGVFDSLHKQGEKSPTFSPDETRIVTFSKAGDVLLFDVFGKQLAQFRGIFEGFNRSGQYLIVHTDDTFMLVDHNGQVMSQVKGDYGQFSPDGQQWVVVSRGDS